MIGRLALIGLIAMSFAFIVVDSKCAKAPPPHQRHSPRRSPPRHKPPPPRRLASPPPSPPPATGPGPYTAPLMALRSDLAVNSMADAILTDWTNDTNPCGTPNWVRVLCNATAAGGPAPAALNLSSIELSGDLPASLWALRSLTFLDVGSNYIGALPDSVSNLTHLLSLNLSTNSIPELPAGLYRLLGLRTLSVANNAVSGPFPAMVSSLTALEDLQVQRNGWSGAFPPSLLELVKLTALDVSFTNLDGPLPKEMSSLSDLRALSFQKVVPSGTPQAVPTVVTTLQQLATLNLVGNNFNGSSLPPSYSSLTGLDHLLLSNTLVGGTLPSGWSSFSRMMVLDLHANALTGSLPQAWCGLNATLLNSRLSVADNLLTGALPLCPVWLSADTKGNKVTSPFG